LATIYHQVWIDAPVGKAYEALDSAEGLSSHPKQSPATAWTGTHIRFEIKAKESPGHWIGLENEGKNMTVLDFYHSGWWDEANEFFDFCNFAWGETL
jgi:hypothetical protein